MKKFYETAQIDVVMFEGAEVIVASANLDDPTTPTYNRGDDETEIL